MLREQQVQQGLSIAVGVIDPDNQYEIGLLLNNGGREEHAWHPGNQLCAFCYHLTQL